MLLHSYVSSGQSGVSDDLVSFSRVSSPNPDLYVSSNVGVGMSYWAMFLLQGQNNLRGQHDPILQQQLEMIWQGLIK